MNELFEYSDILRSPIEAFHISKSSGLFPVKAHWHYFVEIPFCMKGRCNVVMNGEATELKMGDLIFIPPQAVHSFYEVSSDEDYLISVLKFNISRLNLKGENLPNFTSISSSILSSQMQKLIFTQKDFVHTNLNNLFNLCESEVNTKQPGYETMAFSQITSMLIEMLRAWTNSESHSSKDAYPGSKTASFDHVLEFIDKHSSQNIQINDLAAMCNMSYSHFARSFKHTFGRSCKQYIEFIRLSKVENLLLFSDFDLNYIAEETGFSDCSHLIRCFKKNNNITPKQFRLLNGK